MNTFDPNNLLIFVCIHDAGGISAAGERLNLPKSTVSRRLKELEEALGERLFLRTTRRLKLTEFGAHLLEHARQIADEVDAVRALAEHRQAQPSGRLRVSMPGDFASLLLVDMLAAFTELHPAVRLELDLSPRRVDIVGEGFDLAVRMGALPDDGLLAARRLARMCMGLFAAPAYLGTQGLPGHPHELMQHRALLLSTSGSHGKWLLQRGGETHEIRPSARIAANSPELLIKLAQAGAGIACVPRLFALPLVQCGALTPLLQDWQLPAQDAWAVFPGRHLMPAKTRAFITLLQTALSEDDGSGKTGG